MSDLEIESQFKTNIDFEGRMTILENWKEAM